jgi:MerR family mercuric resistance operon transcriptional regulator
MPTPRTFGIGELARESGVGIETVRYYERSELMPNPPRTEGGRRIYTQDHLKRLVFIRRCRELGFSLEEIRGLLDLVDGKQYTCGEVQAMTLGHAETVRRRIASLRRLEKTLSRVAAKCSGGTVPDCPIIDALLDPTAPGLETPAAPLSRSARQR